MCSWVRALVIGRDELAKAVDDVAAAYGEFRVEDAPDPHALDDYLEALGVDPEAFWTVAQNALIDVAGVARVQYVRPNDEAWSRWLLHQSALGALWFAVGRATARAERTEAAG